MCGICGEVGKTDNYQVDEFTIKKMADFIAHRGPDDQGIYIDRRVGLGHRRLSIIDLSTGNQPISNEDKSIWVIFNGEIYNYQPLRKYLLSQGHRFTTQSDTEVIVHLYEEFGIEFIGKLRGMFAIALWDNNTKELLLIRDRLGKKPLFYAELPGSFIFSSEVKSILIHPDFTKDLNPLALHDFLSFKFIPRQDDLIKNVHKLPPASYMVVRNGQHTIKKYWNLTYQIDNSMTESDAIEQAEALLKESVEIRMISDVPIGAFLSSGLDSGLIVSIMSKLSSSPVNTFSIGDSSAGYNELPKAKIISDKYASNHYELIVNPDAIRILPDLIWNLDGPYADVPALPMYYVAQLAHNHVKVVLTGDGGDESFAGYDRYIANILLQKYRTYLPQYLRQKCIPAMLNLFEEKTERKSFKQSWRWFNTMSLLPPEQCYARGISFFSFQNEEKDQLYTDSFRKRVQGCNSLDGLLDLFSTDAIQDIVDKMSYCDLMVRVPEYSNIKIDRITMMHGLEARCPFLDHKLIEFAATIPSAIKLRLLNRKNVLKKMAKRYLPDEIIKLPKQGFASPINKWLRNELQGLSEKLLNDSRMAKDGIFDPNYLKLLLSQHSTKKFNHGTRIWAIINAEIWYRINFGESSSNNERDNLKDTFESWKYNAC